MQTKTLGRTGYLLDIPEVKAHPVPAVIPAAASAPAVVDTVSAAKRFSHVESLNREIAIVKATPAIALAGCAVAYGVTQALNPNSLGAALVCLAPFIMGIAGPILACQVEAMRRRRHDIS